MTVSIDSAALLLGSEHVQGWEKNVIEQVASETGINFELIILEERRNHAEETESLAQTLIDMSLWEYYRAYRRRRPTLPARTRSSVDQMDCLDDAKRMWCQPIPSSPLGNKLPTEAVEQLETVDVTFRFGFGILKGAALDAPTSGTLSFHGGDLRRYRGRPAGFWEFLQDEQTVGATVQRISETLDGGEIVAFDTVDITNENSWPAVQQSIFAAAPELFVRAVRNLSDPEYVPEKPEELGSLYTTPGAMDVVRYLLTAAKASIRNR